MKKLLFNLLLLLMVAIGAVAQQSLPYSYGFEDNDLSADGWTMSNCYSSTGINSSAAKTGTYGFRFYYRSNPPQYLISPELTGTTNGVQVEFYYKNSSSSYAETFQVGYSTTDNSTGSFTWGTEITASNQEWTLFSETFPANTKYVSVKLNSDDQFYLYLDDFEFAVPASCIKPNALTASNITHNSADFSWTQNSLTTDWVLEYSTNSDFSDATSKNVNGTPSYTLSNLNSTTTYYARVKADCGGGDESEWSDAISFSTTAVAEEVGDGWSDNFEGATCGWVLVNGTLTNAWAWGEAVNNGGSHAIYVSNDGGTTNAYTITSATMVYATKLLNFATGKYEFSYDWIANGESSWDYLRVALVPASVTLTAGTSVPSGFSSTALPSGWIALDGGSKLNLVTAWQTKELAVNVTAGNYYLVFAWRDDTSGGTNPPAAVDNVSITRVACEYDVTDLAVSNITTTGAKLTWTAGEASEWQVAYSTSSDFAGATEEIVSEATYNMTSLTSATTYYVKVRAYCGGSDYGAWSSVLEFPTACDAITSYPWEENFDSYSVASSYTAPSTRVLPICWNAINTTTYTTYQPFPTIFYNSSTNYANSTPNCLKLYSYYSSYGSYDPQPQYAILPQMENLNTKRIVLWARGYNANSTFKIGLMTDPTDASTFVQIGNEQTLTTSYQKLTINLTGTGNYIAIMIDAATSSRTNNGVYIDNITVEEQPTCLAPTALTVASYTANTATLTWTAGATESAWNLRYKADADWTVIEDVESPYTLSGLASDTDYEVQVQANCGSGDLSEWTNSVEFYTGYCQPAPTSVDGSGITNVSFGIGDVVVNNSERPTSTPYYGNYYTQIGAVQAGVEATVNITYGTGFTYGTIIWIDLNNNLIFDGEEVVYAGVSTNANPTTLAATFTLPASTPTGDYRMRIAGADSYYDSYTASIAAAANAPSCPTSSYTVVHDYTVRVLEAPSCVTPTALTVSNIMGRTANLAWTLGNDETAWQICLNDEEGNLINADSNPFTLTGLTPETTYQVKVRANCGGDGVSEWSANVSFTTTVSCLAPTALAATLTPGNGTIATLSWTENGTATDWVLEYGTEADFAGATSVNVNGTPSADLTGLTAESTYYARVKAACDVDDESAWSSTINFTPTDAYSVTLNDGTSTNSYVPVYGLYVDELSRSQFVIPASDLTDLQWGSINKLTFYSSNASVDWEDAEFDVRMKEVDNTTISSLEDWDGMSLAYHGSLGISGNVMEITFTTPYTYQGGNLLIGTNETTSGTYVSCYWYGVSATGSSLGGHDSSISQQNFLPKVTIEYTPGVAPVVNHTITATAGENGTITPNGETLVEDGESLQFTIAPADCYQIASVTVDDVDVTADLVDGVYTLTNVTADHTIAATFEMATYTITATEPENGTIIGAGSVNCGANAEITISPASCYQIASVTVDDVDVTADLVDGVYTFANVTANHTIAATFEQTTYTI
ncbi:MAG: fibronectin type III domain-containing protein, partial [Bacteroidales bacterium]|nr:fibronectin type III domain-containing protein [Bacteroidales bacterium]